ncbi:ATP synthase protein 8 [Lasiodiplodia hormozganensis]|uniref:ATP synthase protein 8 n=2 Tax=Lasiodiplodia TaxID=66739 RepID=A0A5N5CU19_9PEZI|nr:ATP synthase f0 subunit 8 [Lasiodiplodia theobromae]KAB2568848.1 ATP synthase protein 8 [Lasiodiplodia theobromae]KAF4534206.1 ATP synthase f0 subunit 8 [Lasiodiplodia theobromae]KAK0650417.1 ATP synthase protein 8 [Lasiodiplodia hormozganensis]
MSSARLLRPLARAVERQAFAAPMSMRTAAKVAPFTPSYNGQKFTVAEKAGAKMQTMLYAGMPQLVPFYWVNETTFAFAIIPTFVYFLSKYFLPQDLRRMAARLFISKL